MDLRPSGFIARALPRAMLIVIAAVAFVPLFVTLAGNEDAANGMGGDFPSFYAAGQIVLDGHIDDLYDAALQRQYQAPFHEDPDEFLYFAYPPITAIAYAPLSALPYSVAYAIQTLASLAALVGAVWLAWPRTVSLEGHRNQVLVVCALALITYPIATAVLGGQNTTFTLLLLVLVWHFSESHASVWAGGAAALMLYKPQYGILVMGILAVARRWRPLAASVVGAFVIYGISAVAMGLRWPMEWLDHISWFGSLNEEVNGSLMVNITGWLSNALGDGRGANLVTIATIGIVGLVSAIIVYRHRTSWSVFGLVAAGVLLLSPSSLAYDTGVALVGFGLFAALTAVPWMVVAAVVVASWSQLAADGIGWSPLFLLLTVLWVGQALIMERQVGEATISPN